MAQTALNPVLGLDHAQGMGAKTKPAVQSGQGHAGGRGRPPRVTGLRREGRGVSQAGPGPSDVPGSVLSPHSPVSPPNPPT